MLRICGIAGLLLLLRRIAMTVIAMAQSAASVWAKIVTLRPGSVGAAKNHRRVARGGLQKTGEARNGLK